MKIEKTTFRTDAAGRFDAETNRSACVSSALGYLFFFIPLIMHPESKFARYHANQGMILLLWMTLGIIAAAMIPYLGPFLVIPMAAFGIGSAVRGVITALRCQAKHIPLIGKLIIIQYENMYSLEM